jgi:hypothetical protein
MKDRNEEGEAYSRNCPQERDKEEDRLCANLEDTEQPNTRAPTRHKNQSQVLKISPFQMEVINSTLKETFKRPTFVTGSLFMRRRKPYLHVA